MPSVTLLLLLASQQFKQHYGPLGVGTVISLAGMLLVRISRQTVRRMLLCGCLCAGAFVVHGILIGMSCYSFADAPSRRCFLKRVSWIRTKANGFLPNCLLNSSLTASTQQTPPPRRCIVFMVVLDKYNGRAKKGPYREPSWFGATNTPFLQSNSLLFTL